VVCDELIVFDVDIAKAEQLKRDIKFTVTMVLSFEELLKRKPTVIGRRFPTGGQSLRSRIMNTKAELIVMSTGALLICRLTYAVCMCPPGLSVVLDAVPARH